MPATRTAKFEPSRARGTSKSSTPYSPPASFATERRSRSAMPAKPLRCSWRPGGGATPCRSRAPRRTTPCAGAAAKSMPSASLGPSCGRRWVGVGEADGEPGEGSVGIASAAVSRRHLIVYRRGSQVLVRDLGSRNGTTLRGLALEGETTVGDGIELRLGREVPLSLCAAGELAGAVAIELGGARYVAPLGPAALGVGRWTVDRGDDGWFELASDDAPPAFAGAIRLAATVTLLQGDAIARERGGAPAFEVRDRDR
jgi:hypothetical protein